MTRLLLVNPNTNTGTTAAMLSVARDVVPSDVTVDGMTAPFGASVIVDEAGLRTAADAVASLVPQIRPGAWDGVIVAAFGDPALNTLRESLPCPVTGLGEAGLMEAAAGDRPFAVVTTTPALAGIIDGAVTRYGLTGLFRGTTLTPGEPEAVMADGAALRRALRSACAAALEKGRPQAIIIGGGPLALAAREISGSVDVPLIEPVPAAARLALCRAAAHRGK